MLVLQQKKIPELSKKIKDRLVKLHYSLDKIEDFTQDFFVEMLLRKKKDTFKKIFSRLQKRYWRKTNRNLEDRKGFAWSKETELLACHWLLDEISQRDVSNVNEVEDNLIDFIDSKRVKS